MRKFAYLVVFLCSLATAFPQVEIYSVGRAGTVEDPIPAGAWITVSCRISGRECATFGPVFSWSVSPRLQFVATDTPTAGFHIPVAWKDLARQITVYLSASGYPAESKTFFVGGIEYKPKERLVEIKTADGKLYVTTSQFECGREKAELEEKTNWFTKEWRTPFATAQFLAICPQDGGGSDAPPPPPPFPPPPPPPEDEECECDQVDRQWLIQRLEQLLRDVRQ